MTMKKTPILPGTTRESIFGSLDRLANALQPADGLEHERQEQEGEDDGQNALNEVGDDRRAQAARRAVGDEQDGDDGDGPLGGDGAAGARVDQRPAPLSISPILTDSPTIPTTANNTATLRS